MYQSTFIKKKSNWAEAGLIDSFETTKSNKGQNALPFQVLIDTN
jgi:hypothetical protein